MNGVLAKALVLLTWVVALVLIDRHTEPEWAMLLLIAASALVMAYALVKVDEKVKG
ncbi:hypothetical protein [Streptomyces sp. WAC 01529]|uniref:hypothetical protein n=1 Tax=Streptomyces sp. WAC 01529 TaxID=2203205 RepID=UPI0013DFA984|nr:hypothetical protein [Streptomyces sp. WAC 01529]